ncbi:hypothetical protein E2I00_014542, partial [Balaenoptera physalus]
MGLLVDLSPDGLMIPEDGVNDQELEAEFLALVGGRPQALEKLKGKGPLPMEAIEKMASLCMRDPDKEEEEGTDEEDVEADDDLLAELNEVLGEEQKALESHPPVAQERLALYQTAIESARQAGDGAKMRRYDRGLKGPVATPSHTPAPSQPVPTNPPAPDSRVIVEGPPSTAPASTLVSAKPQLPSGPCSPGPLAQLQSRQREYKLAALRAKQQGDTATAARHFRVAKSFDAVLEALSRGEPVPAPPRTLLEALEQRMERYCVAAAQAKTKGDQRKARMHERIVKGLEATEPTQQSLVGVLETAMKLANQDEGPEDEEDEEPKKQLNSPAAPTAQPKAPPSKAPQSGSAPAAKAAPKGTSTRGRYTCPTWAAYCLAMGWAAPSDAPVPTAQQQLAFLEGRRKQLLQAALRAKQKNDMEGAKMHLRQAKGLEPMLEASRNGLPVDIAKVPPAPVNKDDFALVQRPGPGLSQESVRRYGELTKLIRQQHEKLADDCKRSMETLKQAFARGLSPGDLDVFVRFDFPYPNVEEAQKDKTSVIKNTDSPGAAWALEEGERPWANHRVPSHTHRGLFKTDRVLGTAQLKLDALETACEVREILEVLDGRRPTGGRLEEGGLVQGGQGSQDWFCPLKQVAGPKGKAPPVPAPVREPGNRSARPLHSLSVLAFDQERLERKRSQWQRAQLEQGGPSIRRGRISGM